MTVTKSLLLGSAAALMMGGAAKAADLPVRKAAPVDYVRVCDFTGAGFFYIPGTDTCIEIGSFVRIEGVFINNSRALTPIPGATGRALSSSAIVNPGRDRDESGFLAQTRTYLDTRTQTAYGTVRAYVQYQIARRTGTYGESSLANTTAVVSGNPTNDAQLRRGFIQFAGITAGRVQSFFDFYADNYNYEGIADSDVNNISLAYTYTVGGGFSATLSLEDHSARNDGIGNILGGTSAVAAAARYAGETVPDVIGVLRYDQTWGSAQLSAVYRDIATTAGAYAGTNGQGFGTADASGFAVQGGLRIKLPMLAAGDDLWLEGAYEDGAYTYMDSGGYMNQSYGSSSLVGGFQHIDHDAIAIHTPGAAAGTYSLSLSKGFSAMAAFNHYFTPNYHDVIFGSYEQTSYGRAKNIDWTLGGLGDASEYRVGNQFLWDPVKNLEIGLEVDYAHIDQTLAHASGVAATALPVGIEKNPSNYEARLRLERDF